jgi:7-keto-8-aminopelargonate synthetase-like enzyme
VHHPGEIWRPAQSRDFSKAAKALGALAGVSGVIDNVLRTSHWRYQWITLLLTGCLAATAAALARMAKSNPAEESTPWKH